MLKFCKKWNFAAEFYTEDVVLELFSWVQSMQYSNADETVPATVSQRSNAKFKRKKTGFKIELFEHQEP